MLKFNKVHCQHVLDGLRQLPDESVDVVITSPPYWNLRDYGKLTEIIWDGTPNCKHIFNKKIIKKRSGGEKSSKTGHHQKGIGHFVSSSQFCSKCNAWKGQLGLEPDFHLYINHLLDIFDEIKRVLKTTGTCWINSGDTYGGSGNASGHKKNTKNAGRTTISYRATKGNQKLTKKYEKCLLAIPERFILGMIERGWILRNKIIWYKPNHMPSSVKDRFANSWEYLLLFSKSKKYFFDLDAVREAYKGGITPKEHLTGHRDWDNDPLNIRGKGGHSVMKFSPKGKNPDDVIEDNTNTWEKGLKDYWNIATKPFKEAHFAVFPEKLIERPIMAGCPRYVCKKCGTPKLHIKVGGNQNAFNIRVRDVQRRKFKHSDRKASKGEVSSYQEDNYISKPRNKIIFGCNCNAGFKQGIVLDPFMGSGTTAVVARRLGRNFIGFELNPEYVKIAEKRLRRAWQ